MQPLDNRYNYRMNGGGMSDQVIPEYDPPVRNCDACEQHYVKSRLGDLGLCRTCEIAETGIRNMIADEVKMIMNDYQQTVLNQIRNRVL